MTEMTVYPSGKKAAVENKQPQTINMKTHACGKEGMQDPENNVLKTLEKAGLAMGAGAIGLTLVEGGAKGMHVGTEMLNDYRSTNDVGEAALGGVSWAGGFTLFAGGSLLTLYAGHKLSQGIKHAYKNSNVAQKVNPAMRKVGDFLAKNAQRAADYVRLTENDTMHKGQYHHTVVPAKDGKKGHTYVNPVKAFMNKFRKSY